MLVNFQKRSLIMIKEYLENEYKEDVKNIFDTEPRYDRWFRIINNSVHWPEIRAKNSVLAKENPDRHFVLSSVFLFHFVVTIALWDEISYNHTFNYDSFEEFFEITGSPEMHLNYWKEWTRQDSEEEFLPKDVEKILDRFGLMRNGVPNRSSEFMLSCIFSTMQGWLNDALLKWNVSKKAKIGVSARVRFLLGRIQEVLRAGYKQNVSGQEMSNLESEQTGDKPQIETKSSVENNSDATVADDEIGFNVYEEPLVL